MDYIKQNLKNNTVANRLELEVEGMTVFIDYKLSFKTLSLIHTEVPPVWKVKLLGVQ